MDNVKDPLKDILQGMARAFFACAWAEACEEAEEEQMMSGAEIFDIMPAEIDTAAWKAANTLAMGIMHENAKALTVIYATLCEACEGEGDREHTPDIFGHYAAMQAMGHGVGLGDAFGPTCRKMMDNGELQIPYVEFGSHSLSRDYF